MEFHQQNTKKAIRLRFWPILAMFSLVLTGSLPVLGQIPAVTMEDTVQVSAPMVTVAEVIATIGAKLEDDWARVESHEFTGLFTSIARDDPGVNGGNYTVFESATRYRMDRRHGTRKVRMWQRERRYEAHHLVSDAIDEGVVPGWGEQGDALIEAIPFTAEAGNRYNYKILESKLIGNSLIYKIQFIPRSKFEALPSGTVWVDYSNWVIRKVDAAMVGAVPMPFVVKDVPFYRLTKAQVGDFWVDAEIHTLARLLPVPLVPVPDNLEVKFVAVGHVINGSPGMVSTTVDTSEFWLSEDDAKEELKGYWEGVRKSVASEESAAFHDSELMAVGDLDSLALKGSELLDGMADDGDWMLAFNWVEGVGFNRVQGVVFGIGADVAQVGRRGILCSGNWGYGLASDRMVWELDAEIPLVSGSWGRSAGYGIQYTALGVDLQVAQKAIRFAGDVRLASFERSLSAFLYGHDPNHYFEERSATVGLIWRATRRLDVTLECGYARQSPMAEKTDWNLFGAPLAPGFNRQISQQNLGWAGLRFQWSKGPWSLDGAWSSKRLSGEDYMMNSEATKDSETINTAEVKGSWSYLDKAGNRWALQGRIFTLDKVAPSQMQVWYGDWGSLRGHPAGAINGDSGQNVTFDLRFGFDLWETLGVPLLGGLGLQSHVFADYAATQSKNPDRDISGNRGSRWDVGFGFGKLVGNLIDGKATYLRAHAALPLGSGSEGLPWRILVGLGN
jgi:hypothetical protein